MKTLSIRNVTDELHKQAKIMAIKAGITLEHWIIEAMKEKIKKEEGR